MSAAGSNLQQLSELEQVSHCMSAQSTAVQPTQMQLAELVTLPLGAFSQAAVTQDTKNRQHTVFRQTACNCYLQWPCAAHLRELDKDNFSPSHISSCARSA